MPSIATATIAQPVRCTTCEVMWFLVKVWGVAFWFAAIYVALVLL
jgi:hypothetical protein